MLDLAFALEDTYVNFPLLLTHLSWSLVVLPSHVTCLSIEPAVSYGIQVMPSMCLDGADTRSRLGCQVFLTKEVDGMVAKLPSATRNMYVDGESFPSFFSPLLSSLFIPIRCVFDKEREEI
jgi:hypothetical protein